MPPPHVLASPPDNVNVPPPVLAKAPPPVMAPASVWLLPPESKVPVTPLETVIALVRVAGTPAWRMALALNDTGPPPKAEAWAKFSVPPDSVVPPVWLLEAARMSRPALSFVSEPPGLTRLLLNVASLVPVMLMRYG